MKSPPFLLGAALLFWGWSTGFLAMGVLMAAVLEGARWVGARWEVTERDFDRIWAFCSVLLLAAAVYAFNANDGVAEFRGFLRNPNLFGRQNTGMASSRTVASVMRWLPMIYFLLAGAQAYGSRQGVPLESVSFIARRRARTARKLGLPPSPPRLVDLTYPYFGLCLLGASYHVSEDTTFFWGMAVLLAWALWPRRSQRFGMAAWVAALAAAITLGYWGQHGLGNLQRYVLSLNPGWFFRPGRHGFDPTQSRTELGQVGRSKKSGRIVIRLEPKEGRVAPGLLRAASYNGFRASVWHAEATEDQFDEVRAENNGIDQNSYVLLRGKVNLARVSIACYVPGGKGLLPLPTGAARLENLVAFLFRTNRLGAALEEGPGLVIFDAWYGPGRTFDSPAGVNDLRQAPDREAAALDEVISELNLQGKGLGEVLPALQTFFQDKFAYGYWDQHDRITGTNQTPLSRFLLHTRRGHCEYFATATVLLLRRLNFPTRYAVGYAVHEPAARGYVVRERDAHAWCLVWRDGTWQDFDTTPLSWIQAEEQRASPLQFLSDIWSRVWFEFSKFFWGQGNLRRYIFWSLFPVLGVLLIQIVLRLSRQRRRLRREEPEPVAWPGLDSELYQLERVFARRGLARHSSEPLSHWLGRAAADPALADARGPLQDLLRLHYRYRFDPLGLSPSEREALRLEARACLARLGRANGPAGRITTVPPERGL